MRGQVEFGWSKEGPQRSDMAAGRSIA
jgi:hypothetical protein